MIDNPRLGDLVRECKDWYRGIIVRIDGETLTVFLENGLTVTGSPSDFKPTHIKSKWFLGRANFAEILKTEGELNFKFGDGD